MQRPSVTWRPGAGRRPRTGELLATGGDGAEAGIAEPSPQSRTHPSPESRSGSTTQATRVVLHADQRVVRVLVRPLVRVLQDGGAVRGDIDQELAAGICVDLGALRKLRRRPDACGERVTGAAAGAPGERDVAGKGARGAIGVIALNLEVGPVRPRRRAAVAPINRDRGRVGAGRDGVDDAVEVHIRGGCDGVRQGRRHGEQRHGRDSPEQPSRAPDDATQPAHAMYPRWVALFPCPARRPRAPGATLHQDRVWRKQRRPPPPAS